MGAGLLPADKQGAGHFSSDNESSCDEERNIRPEESKLMSDDPARVPTKFKILTEISEYELFSPISLYLK
jgi:hypothetical protein